MNQLKSYLLNVNLKLMGNLWLISFIALVLFLEVYNPSTCNGILSLSILCLYSYLYYYTYALQNPKNVQGLKLKSLYLISYFFFLMFLFGVFLLVKYFDILRINCI